MTDPYNFDLDENGEVVETHRNIIGILHKYGKKETEPKPIKERPPHRCDNCFHHDACGAAYYEFELESLNMDDCKLYIHKDNVIIKAGTDV